MHGFLAEEAILRDTDRTEQAIKANDAAGVVNCTSSIARRANRVLQVAQQEADNSEDPAFVDRVTDSVRDLRASKCQFRTDISRQSHRFCAGL